MPFTTACAAAILAGGRARRLGGRDKCALMVGSSRIIDRQIAVLREITADVFIVANESSRYAAYGLPVVPDAIDPAGPLSGIYTALTASPHEQTIVLACDMPFMTVAFVQHLVEAGADADAAIPRTAGGYQPLCASYARRCAPIIARRVAAGALKVTDLLADLSVREVGPNEIVRFDPEGTLFVNVNTPEDYERAEAIAARQRG